MVLSNVEIVGMEGLKNICIKEDKICLVSNSVKSFPAPNETLSLRFENAIAFPGLINSHDHLDFNLFPPLGNKIYNNYKEWGNDIHHHNKIEINNILKIPQHIRTRWGVYKNLLNGITTVVNHGEKLITTNDIITIFQECHSIHSTSFEQLWQLKLNNFFKQKKIVVMHIGEGTDLSSSKEIDKLIGYNFFKKDLIGVHGVAMNEKQACFFKALVWCPATNHFLLGKTANIKLLKNKTNILFGTDSTLTASWNLWEHLRLAQKDGAVSDNEILDMLTTNACFVWNLKEKGKIEQGKQADIVIASKKNNLNGIEAFFDLNPEDILLVIKKGAIKLFDETLRSQLKNNIIVGYDKIMLKRSTKYVFGNINELINDIKRFNPDIELPISPFTENNLVR